MSISGGRYQCRRRVHGESDRRQASKAARAILERGERKLEVGRHKDAFRAEPEGISPPNVCPMLPPARASVLHQAEPDYRATAAHREQEGPLGAAS